MVSLLSSYRPAVIDWQASTYKAITIELASWYHIYNVTYILQPALMCGGPTLSNAVADFWAMLLASRVVNARRDNLSQGTDYGKPVTSTESYDSSKVY